MSGTGWQRGVRLGIDVGNVRIGVARSDPDGILATPVVTVARDQSETDKPTDLAEIAKLVEEYDAIGIVVGLPIALNGKEGLAAAAVRGYAARLTEALPSIPVHMADERMSTVVAGRRLAERGVKGKRQRAVVDQAAAVEILQGWLDAQRRLRG
ncbi:Holliday junction resolvase RuvX [Longispora urticae]